MIIGSIKTMTGSMVGGLGAIALLMVIGSLAVILFAPQTRGMQAKAGADHEPEADTGHSVNAAIQ
jgi:hypothetical protein